MTAHSINVGALARRAGHILFTDGPEQPAATARETCVLLDLLAAAEAERDAARKQYDEDIAYWIAATDAAEARIAEEKRLRMKATAAATQAEAGLERAWEECAALAAHHGAFDGGRARWLSSINPYSITEKENA